jgi:type IV secretory pathway VirB2 component (pilin)
VAEETLNGAVRTMMALGIVALSMMAMVRVAQASEGRSAGFDGGV